MNNKKYWFFGSKLNTALLLVLIILMIIALRWMYENKETYFPTDKQNPISEDWKKYPIDTTPGFPYGGGGQYPNEILGNKEDLISFSIKPGQEVSGEMTVTGILKGEYFFEGAMGGYILDRNKKRLPFSNVGLKATSDWTKDPVSFTGIFDFRYEDNKGLAYIELTKDNPSGLPENDNSILIPIVIK